MMTVTRSTLLDLLASHGLTPDRLPNQNFLPIRIIDEQAHLLVTTRDHPRDTEHVETSIPLGMNRDELDAWLREQDIDLHRVAAEGCGLIPADPVLIQTDELFTIDGAHRATPKGDATITERRVRPLQTLPKARVLAAA